MSSQSMVAQRHCGASVISQCAGLNLTLGRCAPCAGLLAIVTLYR
jgi:hypothetical protein